MSIEREYFEIDEHRREIFQRDGWRCQYPGCHRSASQVAHGLGKGKYSTNSVLIRWNGEYNEDRNYNWIKRHVINHNLNLFSCCDENGHNDFFNESIASNPEAAMDKLASIRDNLKSRGIV